MFYMDLNFKGDRFDMSKYMESDGSSRDPLTSDFFMELMDTPKEGELILSPDMEHRPDLISYSLYGTTKLWWVLAIYNSRIRYDEFISGDRIAYPALASIEEYYFTALRKIKKEDCLARRVQGMQQ